MTNYHIPSGTLPSLAAQEAKEQFTRGIEGEAFDRLENIAKTINVLKDFKTNIEQLVTMFVNISFETCIFLNDLCSQRFTLIEFKGKYFLD